MECIQERLHLPYVFKNVLQRANWKDKSAKWSPQGSGNPAWGFRANQGLNPLETPHCSHWAFSFSRIVSLLLFLSIWFLQSLSSITTQILFSCTWFSISSLSPFSVVSYAMLWSVLSWHGPAVKKAPSNHSPFIFLTACERRQAHVCGTVLAETSA